MLFDAKTGLFQLVFANTADDYYTASGIRTDFLSYLRMQLIDDDFRYLCFIDNTDLSKKLEYQLILTGGLTDDMIREEAPKKGFFPMWGKKGEPADSDSVNKCVIEADARQLRRYVRNLLAKMGTQKGYAVVCPLDIFAVCCEDPYVLGDFISRQRYPNRNIVILTGSVCAEDHDMMFEHLANTELPADAGLFRNDELFPNIREYIKSTWDRDHLPRLPKLIFTYEFLKNAFGERMKILNTLGFDTFRAMLRYLAVHNPALPMKYPSECYAALVYAWYESEQFRSKYPSLDLPENPLRENAIVADAVMQPRFYEIANHILKVEGAGEAPEDIPDAIIEAFSTGENGVTIRYDETMSGNRLPEIYYYLTVFRRKLKGHEDLLTEDEWRDIGRMLRFFGKPSYSLHIHQTLPHERCGDYRREIQSLYDSLKKELWNKWDETSVKLLFVMFKRCYEHAKEVFEDENNTCGQYEFKACINTIKYCMRQSLEYPNESIQAGFVYNQTKRVLCCKNPDTVRTYSVSEAKRR